MKRIDKKWKAFDFGPPEKDITRENNSMKEPKEIVERPISKVEPKTRPNFDFFKAIAPKTVKDLAVHSKKIEEVKFWLENNILGKQVNKDVAKFLLISGPTGSGKTSTVQALCNSMNIHITEWINPADQDYELVKGPNQINRFIEFLTENRWNSLFCVNTDHKVIIVEDFPNILLRHPEEFENVLEEAKYKSGNAVVFIYTHGMQNDTLFTQELKLKYQITQISFNACANTLMKNALQRAHKIVTEHSDIFQVPSASTMDAIISSTMGDIRCAVNQFYFASLKGSNDLPMEQSTLEKSGSKRKRPTKVSTIKTMLKDENLGLFHSLGRVFNPKRKSVQDSWRINCDIDALIEEFSFRPTTYAAFLFENYIKYFGAIQDVTNASDVLSLTQTLLNKWTDKQDTVTIAMWLAVLGLMVFNEHKVSKWNQIKGPKKTLEKKYQLNQGAEHLSVTDYYYYNCITKRAHFHSFHMKNS